MRRETRFARTQVTSAIALLSIESFDGSLAYTHHARETTVRKIPSFPLLMNLPQSLVMASPCSSGHPEVHYHFGWAADHQFTHLASKVSISLISGRWLAENWQWLCLNHLPISSGQGPARSWQEAYHLVSEVVDAWIRKYTYRVCRHKTLKGHVSCKKALRLGPTRNTN